MPEFDGAAGPVYYREWLEPQPRATVVFAHGVGEHAGLYDRYAGHLRGHGLSLRALDQLGHGRTAAAGAARRGVMTSADDLVADIAQLTAITAAADPGVPLVLQGHSLGAIMAAVAAARQPGRYAAVVLSGATLAEPDGFGSGGPDADLGPGNLSADPDYRRWLAEDPLVFTEAPEMTESLHRVLPPAWAELAVRRPALDGPVLLVHGEDDPVSPVSGARHWAAALPRARLAVFPGARHDVLNETVHEQVAQVIAQFIGGVTGAGHG